MRRSQCFLGMVRGSRLSSMNQRPTNAPVRTLSLPAIAGSSLVLRSLSLLVICACIALSLAGQSNNKQELPNFHQVNSQLYRGAQPGSGGVKRLAQMGIKTIVNLRGADELTRAEEAQAGAVGLRYFNVPFQRTGRPTDQQVERVLAILNGAENQPAFVHCQLGADRTGLVIAVYRITHDGWTSEQAQAEAKKYGLHAWELGMKNYIHDYARRFPKPAR